MKYDLKAKTAKAARIEAARIEPTKPKKLFGYDQTGECVYIGLVREHGNRAPTATASKGDDVRSYARFECVVEDSDGFDRLVELARSVLSHAQAAKATKTMLSLEELHDVIVQLDSVGQELHRRAK